MTGAPAAYDRDAFIRQARAFARQRLWALLDPTRGVRPFLPCPQRKDALSPTRC